MAHLVDSNVMLFHAANIVTAVHAVMSRTPDASMITTVVLAFVSFMIHASNTNFVTAVFAVMSIMHHASLVIAAVFQ